MKNILILLIVLFFAGCSIKEPILKDKTIEVQNIKVQNIINDYLKNNYLLMKEKENIIQAFYNNEISKIKLFPALNFNTNLSHSKNFDTNLNTESNSISFNSSYDVDLWGSIKNNIESTYILEKVAQENYNLMIIENVKSIIDIYNNTVYINNQLSLKDILINKEENRLAILTNRYSLGEIDLEDITYSESLIDDLKIDKSTFLQEKAALKYELEKITALEYNIKDTEFFFLDNSNISILNLIERPDLKAALLGVEEQGLSVENAINNKYPSLSLNMALSSTDDSFNFNNWLGSLVGNIVFTIVDYNENKLLELIEESKLNSAKYNFSYLILNSVSNFKYYKESYQYEKKSKEYLLSKLDNYNKDLSLLKIKSNYEEVDVLDFNSKEKSILNLKVKILESKFKLVNINTNLSYITNNI